MRANAHRGRSTVSALFVLAVLTSFCLAGCADEGGDQARDAQALACLSYGDEGRVADAAVLSGLASAGTATGTVRVDGAEVSPWEWRQRQPIPFASACEIVVSANRLDAGAAEPSGGSSGGAFWSVLWPLVVGAVLTLVTTFVTTGWRERMTIARRHSTALRAAAAAYAAAIDAFLTVATDPVQPEPTGAELTEPRRKLVRVLDEFPRTPRIPQIDDLRRLVGDGAIGRDLADGWADPRARSADSDETRAARAGLDELRSTVDAITEAQDRPLRTSVGRLTRPGAVRASIPGENR